VSYKIISKDLTLKLILLLPLTIRPKKTHFVKGHYILDNVIVIWEGMEWARVSDQEALFIKIDFEKTYDKIEWQFILSMLQELGFGPVFLHYI